MYGSQVLQLNRRLSGYRLSGWSDTDMNSFRRRLQIWSGLSVAQGRLRSLVGNACGAILLETIMAVGVLAIVAAGTSTGLSLVSQARTRIERDSIAEFVVRNQMEYIFSLGYKTPGYTYSTSTVPSEIVTSTPSGYTVTAHTTSTDSFPGDADLTKIVVTVSRGSEVILVIETLRTNK